MEGSARQQDAEIEAGLPQGAGSKPGRCKSTAAKTAPVAAGVKENKNAPRPPSFDYFTQHFDR